MDNLLKSFTEDCMRTEQSNFHAIKDSEDKSYNVNRLLHAALGLTTEVGEAVDPIKKSLFYGKPLDRTNVLEEVGDAMWYMAVLLDELDSSFEEAGSAVINKLRARYPEKYTNEHAIDRDTASERSILEENLKKDDRTALMVKEIVEPERKDTGCRIVCNGLSAELEHVSYVSTTQGKCLNGNSVRLLHGIDDELLAAITNPNNEVWITVDGNALIPKTIEGIGYGEDNRGVITFI